MCLNVVYIPSMFHEVVLSLLGLNVESRAAKVKALMQDECMFGMSTFFCCNGECTCNWSSAWKNMRGGHCSEELKM